MALVKQATNLPTRKIFAVLISGMILGGVQSMLHLFWPDHPFAPYMEYADIWLQGIVMVAAGYFTKEREQEIVTQVVVQAISDEKPVDSVGSEPVPPVVRQP